MDPYVDGGSGWLCTQIFKYAITAGGEASGHFHALQCVVPPTRPGRPHPASLGLWGPGI